jgi:hypothetical protein
LDKILYTNSSEAAEATTVFRSRFAKHNVSAFDYAEFPIAGAQSVWGNKVEVIVHRNADLLGPTCIVAHLPALIVSEDKSVSDSCPNTTNKEGFPVHGCGSCQQEDLRPYIPYAKEHTVNRWNAGVSLSPHEIQEAKREYSKCTGVPLDCEMVDDCPCAEDFNSGVYAYWCNATGFAMIPEVELHIGGNKIDVLYREFAFMHEELSGFSGKRLCEMINKHTSASSLICASTRPLDLYIPLNFYFARSPGLYLPLAALAFHQVKFVLKFAPLKDLICVSKPSVMVSHPNGASVSLTARVVYLAQAERENFAKKSFTQVISQGQYATVMRSTGAHIEKTLFFNLALRYILFALRRDCNTRGLNWFNFSGCNGLDSVQYAELRINNNVRFSDKGSFFRTVEPYLTCNNIPNCFCYLWSFGLQPFDPQNQSHGTLNASRVDSLVISLTLQEDLKKEYVDLFIFAESLNLLKFHEGLAGLTFAP